ncbi:MAG: AraC family transcriptional regulator [Actinomycetota bacterium]
MQAHREFGATNDSSDAVQRCRLRDVVATLADHEGLRPTNLPGVLVYRSDTPTAPVGSEYHLGLCVAVQGRKRVLFGEQHVDFDPMNGLLVGIPLALQSSVVDASPHLPCLTMVVEIAPAHVREIAAHTNRRVVSPDAPAPGLQRIPLDGALLDVLVRIATASASATDAHVLGPGLQREITYRLLQTDEGARLGALADDASHASRVERAIAHIHDDPARAVTVADLARIACMSPSSFHHSFKDVTSLTPLQYVKRTRLQVARTLLFDTTLSTQQVATHVGYLSASHFSRDFKALYGLPPSRCRS